MLQNLPMQFTSIQRNKTQINKTLSPSKVKFMMKILELNYKLITIIVVLISFNFLSCIAVDMDSQTEALAKNRIYFMRMSKTAIEDFLRIAKKIGVGSKYDDVIAKLGKPYIEKIIQAKKLNAPVTGMIVTYYLEKLDENTVNEKCDKTITFVFDERKNVIKIYAKNVDFTEYDMPVD